MSEAHAIGNGRLQGRTSQPVKDLAGYRKGFRIPDSVNAYSQALVAKLALDDLAADVERVRTSLREIFPFKRKDLDSGATPDGGWVTTPFFEYTVRVVLDDADPSTVVWHRELAKVREPERLPAVEEMFRGSFDRIAVDFPEDLNLTEIVDAVEAADHENITIDYDQNVTWCRVSLSGLPGTMHLTPRRLTFESTDRSIAGLLASFEKVRTVLFESSGASVLRLTG